MRQALLQNQTPEIQAKLLAMQRMIVTKPTTPTTQTISQSFEDVDEDSLSSLDSSNDSTDYKPSRSKPEVTLSKEAKDEQMRYS